ncbi:uncharacterized protein PV09_07295 [Verruconis gallopava]|uniref:Uncharacterized protein n=1 Tax=Verruconis gallopava TaxID=253628 RepID=A0A0D2A371_9PEZI|nr:uncharacterized protein PV09_07295 [Verruconis gallopava]KIW01253.1 hypothetical protein PV09_07295 [Verruconis gallopava]
MADVDTNASFRRGHRRYQSVMAQQFSSQLDDLFNMDGGLDSLVHDVEAKRQSIFVQQRELEELQERIRQAEARLGGTSDEENDADSDASGSDGASRGSGKASESARTRAITSSARQPSIFAIRETKDEEEQPQVQPVAPAPAPAAPVAKVPAQDYVMVRRPRPAPRKHPRVDSHIEISEEEEEDEEDEEDDDEEDEGSSEEESSEEEAAPVRSPARRR